MTTPVRVVFVCVENSCRSQMAQGFARALGGQRLEAFSAGSRPSGRVNTTAIALMAELGPAFAIDHHTSTGLADLPPVEFEAAVTMGCGDECPMLRCRRRFDWQIPDPKHMPEPEFRQVRDRIRQQVEDLLRDLGAPAAPPAPRESRGG